MKINLSDITIRTTLKPGDIGYVIYMHGKFHSEEHNYDLSFEKYVVEGMLEFYNQYDPNKDRVWICEHNERIIGFLLLMHRGKSAQFRYFIIEKEYRGIGLGNKLMELFIEELKKCNYESAYLWTTDELETAAHLYIKYGFHLTEEKKSTEFGKPVIEQKFELNLSE